MFQKYGHNPSILLSCSYNLPYLTANDRDTVGDADKRASDAERNRTDAMPPPSSRAAVTQSKSTNSPQLTESRGQAHTPSIRRPRSKSSAASPSSHAGTTRKTSAHKSPAKHYGFKPINIPTPVLNRQAELKKHGRTATAVVVPTQPKLAQKESVVQKVSRQKCKHCLKLVPDHRFDGHEKCYYHSGAFL